MKLYFSILHYKDDGVTARCVRSLLAAKKQVSAFVELVVIDNGSMNGSLERLKDEFASEEGIYWIESPDNLGFARGNNLAFTFIKQRGDADVAVFLNNDTEITQKGFIDSLCDEIQKRPFDVLAIDVYDPYARQHQSPLCLGGDIERYAKEERARAKAIVSMGAMHRFLADIKCLASKLFFDFPGFQDSLRNRISSYSKNSDWKFPRNDVVPQGACVIYGKNCINVLDFAFYPRTHMYFEECILKTICDKEGLKVRYSPSIQVLHHHHEVRTRENLNKHLYDAQLQRAKKELEAYEELAELAGWGA